MPCFINIVHENKIRDMKNIYIWQLCLINYVFVVPNPFI